MLLRRVAACLADCGLKSEFPANLLGFESGMFWEVAMVEHGARILTWLRGRQEMHDAHVLAWQEISGQAVHDAHVSAWILEQEEISKQEMCVYAEAWPLSLELDEVNLGIEKWSQEKVKNTDISKDTALQEKIEDLRDQKSKLDWRLDPENIGGRKSLPAIGESMEKPRAEHHGGAEIVAAVPAREDGGSTLWMEKARDRAREIIKRDKEKDLYPSQENIADEIANAFRLDGVVGAGGKPMSGSYIKRHALKGISSEQARQLSTANSRSK